MIETVEINSIEALIKSLNELPNNYIFRGLANSNWKLDSTLERVIGDDWSRYIKFDVEKHYLDIFKSKFHIYNTNEHIPTSKLAWLSVMQHYGAPTRLIDFTESPYIALYFALEAYTPSTGNDFAIYALDYSALMEASLNCIKSKDSSFTLTRSDLAGQQDKIFDDIVDRFSYNVVWITEPLELNARIDRQSGTFLISGDKNKKIEELLELELYDRVDNKRFVISQKLYTSIYALLRKMNINAKTIYGDLSGLATSIKLDMQVHTQRFD